jgi:sugar fermentation stimulation protein A
MKKNPGTCLITWPPLTRGTLIRRYKRFLADVELDDGGVITVHCPNSGRMLQCSEPGRPVHLSRSPNPARKHAFTWEIIEMPSGPVVVNTMRANQAAGAALRSGMIQGLAGYERVRSEVAVGRGTRIDFVLEGSAGRSCMVEVKSCTSVEHGIAMFPDAVSERGRRHLVELRNGLLSGVRAVLLLMIQRMDAREFRPADHIDPAWGAELRKAVSAGVEVLAYSTSITDRGMALADRVPVRL